MKELRPYLINLALVITLLSACKVYYYYKIPSESYTSTMTSTIKYHDFPQALTRILLSPQIGLTITKVLKDTIEAIESYQGFSHTSWFIFSTKWIEKTEYKITYGDVRQIKVSENDTTSETSFRIFTKTSEAPNKNYDKWKPTPPSKDPKTYQILKEISKYERQ